MNKKTDAVIVTGATGFLGQNVYQEFKNRGYARVYAVGHNRDFPDSFDNAYLRRVDLTKWNETRSLFSQQVYHKIPKIKGVINLAAVVGGIGANQKRPADFMMHSLEIGINLINAAKANVSMRDGGKFVQIGTVCAYPKYAKIPFKEDDIWNGYPEETNAPYGIAKKTLMELIKAYNIQYPNKFHGISLIPVNLYGPGDNFDLETSHVIPALIRKIDTAIDNNESSVTLWGTGQASREFLFVKDAAVGIVDAFEKYDGIEPVNLGTGIEISIYELAHLIAKKLKFNGTIQFDSSKPDGQPRRCLDVSRAKQEFGFTAKTEFNDGLEQTIQWYKDNKTWLMQS